MNHIKKDKIDLFIDKHEKLCYIVFIIFFIFIAIKFTKDPFNEKTENFSQNELINESKEIENNLKDSL